MKNILLISFGLLILSSQAYKSSNLWVNKAPLAKKSAFAVGEHLTYEVSYGMLTAGVAELSIHQSDKIHTNPVLHMKGIGYSTGMFEWFFKVRDRYESWFDMVRKTPIESLRDVNEGGFIIQSHVTYDQDNTATEHWTKNKQGEYKVPDRVQDMLSAFYYARSHDGKVLKNGDLIDIPIFIDHEVFHFQLKLVKRETIKTKFGKVRCLVFKPLVQEGRIFNEKESVTLWVSDDDNKVPVLLKSKILVGSIKMEIKGMEGLQHPLALVN